MAYCYDLQQPLLRYGACSSLCACCWRRLARASHNGADRGARQSAGAPKFVANCWFQRFIFEVHFWS